MHTPLNPRLGSFIRVPRLLCVAGAALGLAAAPAAARLQSEDVPELIALLLAYARSTQPAGEPPAEPAGEPDAVDEAPPVAGEDEDPEVPAKAALTDALGRRVQPDEPTVLAFKGATVEQVVPFIMEATGKVVLPQPDVLNVRITILNDQPIPRSRALDLVIFALQQNNVAVVETPELVIIRSLTEIDRQDVPVLGPNESTLQRTDLGSIVEKVFALRSASAANLFEIFKGSLPTYAKMSVDPESNQLVIMGNIGLLQRMERLITSLDQPASASLSTETFLLRYADAESIATNIKDLYSQTQAGARQGGGQNPLQQFFQRGGGGGGGGGNQQPNQGSGRARTDVQTSANLRVTANVSQNSVTVLAEKPVLDEIRRQIGDIWDRPLPKETVVPKVYDLKNTDPVKIRDTLTTLFGNTGQRSAGQQQGQQGQQAQTAGANRLYGQFTFEAVPEAGRLLVISKSPENIAAMDDIIAKLDQPQTAGLPQIIELKHAQAEELAEQLNALLSRDGTLAQITRAESGLSEGTASASPFATQQQNTQQAQQQNQQGAAPGTITFWWQRSQPPTTTAGTSNLVSKIRIVPVWRQNSLMVLSPPEYQSSLIEVIRQLDNPGRQVLLSAVIAEINAEDATALGLRWSNSAITPTNQDNAISFGPSTAGTQAGGTITGTKNNLIDNLFDTSVLNLGVNINALLQALSEKTAVNILSEPRIFTSDNQEAEFFSGQDIPFITDSQTNQQGNVVQSFDYRAVGIALRVRPRITINRDVDLRINLELSSVQPNQTLFGGFIVDRRETTTHLIVKDGQTVVVSGILRSEDSDVKRKVPGLGDIPLIGELFTSTERTQRKTELIAFITPVVVGTDLDSTSVTSRDRDSLQALRERLSGIEQRDGDRKSKDAKPQSASDAPPPTPERMDAP